jgi:hypothetical protein
MRKEEYVEYIFDHKSGEYSLNNLPTRKKEDDDRIRKNYYDLVDRLD